MTQIQKLTKMLNQYHADLQGKIGLEHKKLILKIDACERNLKMAQENVFINGGI